MGGRTLDKAETNEAIYFLPEIVWFIRRWLNVLWILILQQYSDLKLT